MARCTIGSDTSEVLLTLDAMGLQDFAVSGDHLYFVESSPDVRALQRVPLAGGEVEVLDRDAAGPLHVAADAVYYGAGSGKIRKLAAGETCPVAVAVVPAEYGGFAAFTGDDTMLFGITTDGQTFSVSR